MRTVLAVLAAWAIAVAASDDGYFSPASYSNLLNAARLMRNFGNDGYFVNEELVGRSLPADWSDEDGYVEDSEGSPYFSGTHARDQEHLEQSSLYGYLSMAGGSSDTDKPNEKPVKTDKQLPAYCNPPNPCPIGKTAKDGCEENFLNTAENNKRLLDQQDCPCDTEHMASCPIGGKTVSSQPRNDAIINSVMDEIKQLGVNIPGDKNPYLTVEDKREKVVAKKSPVMIRKRSTEDTSYEFNPYLQGEKMKRASKKSPPMK